MLAVHLRMLRRRATISGDEQQAIEALVSDIREVPTDHIIVEADQPLSNSLLLLDGWTARSRDLASGERQIAELHVAGDFIDLHGFTLKRLDHDLRSLTACRLAVVPHQRLERMFAQHPRLARIYWYSTNIDAAVHREWLLSLGQRSALSHFAHLLCELRVRLDLNSLADDGEYAFPLTQREIAECLGVTAVHANRTVQELRRLGLISLRRRQVKILDLPRLEALAEFDPRYLYLDRRDF